MGKIASAQGRGQKQKDRDMNGIQCVYISKGVQVIMTTEVMHLKESSEVGGEGKIMQL